MNTCASFIRLIFQKSQQPTKHVKANSARWHKGMCHLQTHVRLHGVPAKLSAALRTNQTKHTLDPEVDSREKSHETMVFNPIGYQVS